jgi:hypothetical protein
VTDSTAASLVVRLHRASEALTALVEGIDAVTWVHVATPGEWSVSKDAEHVGDGAVYHRWIVRRGIGEKVTARRPSIERDRLTAQSSQAEVVAQLRQQTEESAALVGGLSHAQLGLSLRPPRAGLRTLADLIEAVMIGHYRVHQRAIAAKLRKHAAMT